LGGPQGKIYSIRGSIEVHIPLFLGDLYMKPIRVVIADDHKLLRMGIRKILSAYRQLSIVGEASNGKEAIQAVKETDADVLLLDMQMPVMDGLEATRKLVEEQSKTRILVLSAYNDHYYVASVLESGADGYITKDDDPEDILEAIQTVFSTKKHGKKWVSPKVGLNHAC
jgi:two-component system invasion response regulator UvrY